MFAIPVCLSAYLTAARVFAGVLEQEAATFPLTPITTVLAQRLVELRPQQLASAGLGTDLLIRELSLSKSVSNYLSTMVGLQKEFEFSYILYAYGSQ